MPKLFLVAISALLFLVLIVMILLWSDKAIKKGKK